MTWEDDFKKLFDVNPQPAAGERVLRSWTVGDVEVSLLAGWYGKEGDYPVSWRLAKGGRVFQNKNPLTALTDLLQYEASQY